MAPSTHNVPLANPDVITGTPSRELQVVLSWFEAANASDSARFLSLLSKESFVQYVFPEETLKAMGRSTVFDIEQLKEAMAGMSAIMKSIGFIVQEIIESGNKVVVHAKTQGVSATDQPYNMEYMFIFKVESDAKGELKIVEIKEFVDSVYLKEFFEAELERLSKRANTS